MNQKIKLTKSQLCTLSQVSEDIWRAKNDKNYEKIQKLTNRLLNELSPLHSGDIILYRDKTMTIKEVVHWCTNDIRGLIFVTDENEYLTLGELVKYGMIIEGDRTSD